MSDVPRHAVPDTGETSRFETLGPQFVMRLSAVLRIARTHDVSNQAFQRQLQDFLELVQGGLEEESEVTISSAAEHIYLNGVRVRAQASMLPTHHALMAEFERRELGGLRFLSGIHAAELERFFQLFMAADDPAMAQHFAEAVRAASIEHVQPLPPQQLEEENTAAHDVEPTERVRAKRVFWRAVLGTRKILLRATQTGRPDLRHAKRLVQPVVDNIMHDEYSIVGLTALKDHDEYTYAHCVNVSILSISMGHALGLPRQTLADLGVAGLVHDVGKLSIPGEVLRKPAKLSPAEWGMMRQHPVEGLRMMLRMPGLTTLTLDSMRACFEHHMNYDRTGYPDVDREWGQSTLSRIVAVADCFDAMTAHRAYHQRPFTPFESLQFFLGPNRVQYDPAVLWALVRTVGLYPPGSVLQTDTGHLVIALSPNPDDLRRPHCRVLAGPDLQRQGDDTQATWSPMGPEHNVLRVLAPEEHEFRTGEHLAA